MLLFPLNFFSYCRLSFIKLKYGIFLCFCEYITASSLAICSWRDMSWSQVSASKDLLALYKNILNNMKESNVKAVFSYQRFSYELKSCLAISKTNNLLHSSIVKASLCILQCLTLAKNYSNDINNSCAEVPDYAISWDYGSVKYFALACLPLLLE